MRVPLTAVIRGNEKTGFCLGFMVGRLGGLCTCRVKSWIPSSIPDTSQFFLFFLSRPVLVNMSMSNMM